MAELNMSAILPASNAKVIDDPRDASTSAADSTKPKDELDDLTSWVLTRTRLWRDHRRQNYELLWDMYERLWRGLWAPEDKSRKSERSTLITPGLAEAVENIVAEVEEAVFGRGDFFDIKAKMEDPVELKKITDTNKAYLKEDLSNSEFASNVGESLINAAVYGSGIGEIVIETFKKREITASVQAMVPGVSPMAQVKVTEVNYACLQSVNPRNFLIDPTAKTIDKALGCAVEEYVGAHLINAGMREGKYRDVEVGTRSGDQQILVDRQMETEYVHDKVHIIRYYGLVPKDLLLPPGRTVELFPVEEGEQLGLAVRAAEEIEEQAETVDLSAQQPGEDKKEDDSTEPVDGEMVEAVVFIANEHICIKAVQNPYLMEDRPVVAFPWDIVPGRFWGRGVCEKGIVPQKVMDAELRARIDALAYVSAPMMAMDASRLPRGFQLTVRPGKSILTNGDPNTILRPMHFGQLEQSTFTHSQQLDQMIQRATGSLDVIAMSQKGGDTRPGAVSMMLSGIVKRHKRTLMSFVDRFFIPALRKIMWRNMQFYSERYTPMNWNFIASSTMGIIQREYETQNLIQLMNTMEPQSKEYKVLLMGVVMNTGLQQRTQIVEMLQTSIQVAEQAEKAQLAQGSDPQMQALQQQAAQMPLQLQIAETQAKIAELGARTRKQNAQAQNLAMEPQFRQQEIVTKGIYQVGADQQKQEFDRRMALADRLLKQQDIVSNERIVDKQTAATVASERIRANAQPPKTPVPVAVPIPHPIPVPVPHRVHPTVSTFGAPHPVITPFGVEPLVASNARVLP